MALIPYKDAKELLYTLYTENFLEIQELHRTPDFSPLRTFYLFHVPLEKLTLKLLNVCYKAIYNLMAIRKDNLNVSEFFLKWRTKSFPAEGPQGSTDNLIPYTLTSFVLLSCLRKLQDITMLRIKVQTKAGLFS